MLHYNGYTRCIAALFAFALAAGCASAQQAATLKLFFDGINKQILDMAEDFPAEKYDFRLKPEMRSFGEVIVHVVGGNQFAAKAGATAEKVKWDEVDPKNYKTKAEIVTLLKKSIADANATLSANPEGFKGNIRPWLAVIEHSAEHYGLLVAYYRANGMVPPESRPKK